LTVKEALGGKICEKCKSVAHEGKVRGMDLCSKCKQKIWTDECLKAINRGDSS
jgi:hypothetical protein